MSTPMLSDRLAAEVFAMDMAGLRALANKLFAADAGPLVLAGILQQSVEYNLYQPPWPHDDAADLLAAWVVTA